MPYKGKFKFQLSSKYFKLRKWNQKMCQSWPSSTLGHRQKSNDVLSKHLKILTHTCTYQQLQSLKLVIFTIKINTYIHSRFANMYHLLIHQSIEALSPSPQESPRAFGLTHQSIEAHQPFPPSGKPPSILTFEDWLVQITTPPFQTKIGCSNAPPKVGFDDQFLGRKAWSGIVFFLWTFSSEPSACESELSAFKHFHIKR